MVSPQLRFRKRVRARLYPRDMHPFRLFAREASRFARTAKLILDIGCGRTAPDLEAIETAGRKVGIDLNPDLQPVSAPTVEFVRATSDRLPFAEGTFDLVTCKSVLEHLDTPQLAFQEIHRVMSPGGHAVMLTPNLWDYVSIVSTLVPNRFHPWVVRVSTGRPEADTFPTRYRANTAGTIRRLAHAGKLEVLDVLHCREHPHYLAFSTPTYLAGVVMEQAIQRPLPVLRPWLLVTLRKAD